MRLYSYQNFFTIIVIIFFIISCSQSKNNKDTLLIDIGAEPPVLDPVLSEDISSLRVMYDLFAGLIDFDASNNLKSGLAKKWEVSKDGKTYTFYLRDDIRFSDGKVINANDFVYSWRRLVDPKTASNYNFILANVLNAKDIINGNLSSDKLGVKAISNQIFQVKLSNPDASFISSLVLPNTFVVPEHVISKYGKNWTKPEHIVTSGAYVLKEHVINGYILAKKNDYFYDKDIVKIAMIKYLPYSEKNAAIPSYRANNLDITQTIPVDQYKVLKKEFPGEVYTGLQEAIYYYDFNMKNPIFANNLLLRKALSMAINREQLVESVLKMCQKSLYSIVTTTINNGIYKDIVYDWQNLSTDQKLENARKLFKDSGYSEDHPLKLVLSYNTDDLHKKVALTIIYMWQNAFGNAIKVDINNFEWKDFLQKRHKGDYLIARDGWVADYDDISTYIALYLCGSGQNNSHYCNPAFDSLVRQAIKSEDEAIKVNFYKKALQVGLNDYQIIPLFQYTFQQMVKSRVRGYNVDSNRLQHMQTKWMSLKND